MPDFKSIDSLYLILGFIVPGLIIVFIRSRFLTGRTLSHTEALLSYLTLSIICYAIELPALLYVLSIPEPGLKKIICWFGLIFIGPAFLGFGLGLDSQKGFTRGILQKWGINLVHPISNSWDWKFFNTEGQWVLITLKDGSQIAGFCGKKSCASSDPTQRDIYVEQIYDLDEDKTWKICENKSILVVAGEIKTIEFWPLTEGAKHD